MSRITAEEAWAQIEAVRQRVHALWKRESPLECESIEQELADLRDNVWSALADKESTATSR